MTRMTKNTAKKAFAVLFLLALTAISVVLYVRIGKPMTALVQDTEKLRTWVNERGWKSRVIYMGIVCFQVLVAIIPGEPLEMAAGYVFGTVEGTLVCLGGIALGSIIVFGLVRLFGRKLVEVFFSKEKIDSLRIMQDPKRMFLVTAALMILPGTPKDLLTYCAGLTKISWSTWLLICTVGRIPSVITSTLGGSAVSKGNYAQAAIVFIATALLCGAGLWVFAKMKSDKIEKKSR